MSLNPVWPVSLQNGDIWTRDMHVGTPREDESRALANYLQSQRNSKDCQQTLPKQRVIEQILSHSPQKDQLCEYLGFRFLASKIIVVLNAWEHFSGLLLLPL